MVGGEPEDVVVWSICKNTTYFEGEKDIYNYNQKTYAENAVDDIRCLRFT